MLRKLESIDGGNSIKPGQVGGIEGASRAFAMELVVTRKVLVPKAD